MNIIITSDCSNIMTFKILFIHFLIKLSYGNTGLSIFGSRPLVIRNPIHSLLQWKSICLHVFSNGQNIIFPGIISPYSRTFFITKRNIHCIILVAVSVKSNCADQFINQIRLSCYLFKRNNRSFGIHIYSKKNGFWTRY